MDIHDIMSAKFKALTEAPLLEKFDRQTDRQTFFFIKKAKNLTSITYFLGYQAYLQTLALWFRALTLSL